MLLYINRRSAGYINSFTFTGERFMLNLTRSEIDEKIIELLEQLEVIPRLSGLPDIQEVSQPCYQAI